MRAMITLVGRVMLSVLAASCSDGGSDAPPSPAQPTATPVTLLTTANPNGDEDDPFVALDSNGNVHIVWLSDRDGTKDLYRLKSTGIDLASGTISWGPIEQLTAHSPAPVASIEDNYPSILIDDTGVIHLTWHRVTPQVSGGMVVGAVSHIMYKRSNAQGIFSAAGNDESPITNGSQFDRFPRFSRFSGTDLRIYFTAKNRPAGHNKNEIYLAQSNDNGSAWPTLTEVPTLNTAGEQSALPTIAKLSPTAFVATLTRWATNAADDFLDQTADIFVADSTDGNTWNTPQRVTADTPDDKLDLAPGFFFNHTGTPFLGWATTGTGDPLLDLLYLPLSQLSQYPAAAIRLNPAQNVTDHSVKVLPLTINGQQAFLTVWVRIFTPPHNQVVYRLSSSL